MVYTDDAINGTLQLMEAPKEKISVRTSYNLQGITFTPAEIAAEIKKRVPGFRVIYKIDPLRQGIADSWPRQLNDAEARSDWGWNPRFALPEMTKEILEKLTPEMIHAMTH